MVRRKILKFISSALSVAFICGEACAAPLPSKAFRDTLAPSVISGNTVPGRSEPVKEDVAAAAQPGAIGNGPVLVELLEGKLFTGNDRPARLPMEGKTAERLKDAVLLADDYCDRAGQQSIDKAHETEVAWAARNLRGLYSNLAGNIYLHDAIVRNTEDYLVEFRYPVNGDGRYHTGLAADFIDRLYSRYPEEIAKRRLAQYIFHASIPERLLILNGEVDRASHRANYRYIQTAIFGAEEVAALGRDIREFIDFRLDGRAADLASLPTVFHENLKRYGLSGKSLKLLEIVNGQPKTPEPGADPLRDSLRCQLIVSTTALQALQASNYVGLVKTPGMDGEEFGKLADGAAVTVGRKTLEFMARAYGVTIIIAGNEGRTRDGSAAMPSGYVINPGAPGGAYLYIGDSIEVTNGIKDGRSGSSSMMALFPATVPFEIDGYKISLFTDLPHAEGLNPVITENNSLEGVLARLMQARGLSLKQLVEKYDIMTLDRHKNDELIAEAKRLGFTVHAKKDGDPVPAILRAVFGVPDEKGKKLIVLSTGGGNEHRMAQIAATLHGESAMATTYASTASLKAEDKKTSGSLRATKNWTEKDLAEFTETNDTIRQVNKELGLEVPLLPQTPEELDRHIENEATLAEKIKGNSAVGIASITGASAVDAGVLKSYIDPVTYQTPEDGKENVRVNGFFVNEKGRLYIYELVLQSDNMAKTREAMISDNDYRMESPIKSALLNGSPGAKAEAGEAKSQVEDIGMAVKEVGFLTKGLAGAASLDFVILMKKNLPMAVSGSKEALIDETLKGQYQIMKQRLNKLFANGGGVIEVETRAQLTEQANALIARGLKVIVLDDNTLTRGLGEKDISGRPGENYCIVAAEAVSGLDALTVPFVNLNAMAAMGVSVLYGDTTLFQIAYKTFTGKEAPPGLIDGLAKKILWVIRTLPRAVRVVNDVGEQENLRKLFAAAA